MIRVKTIKHWIAAVMTVMMICGMMLPSITAEASGAETSLSSKPWKSSMTDVLDSRNGEDYNAAGMCTGYVAWAIKNSDLYDVGSWPTNGLVADFEERLKDRGVSRVSQSEAKAGDIVIFGDSHIAIYGEDGMLHHNTTSRGIRSHEETIDQWLEYGGNKTGEVKIYRGFSQKVKITVVKKSDDTSQTEDNSCYSLEGAVYGLYTDDSSSPVVKLTTDADGKASVTISQGTYTLKEITAPKGYIRDTNEYIVKADENVTKTVYDVPQNQEIEIAAYKTDGEIHSKWSDSNISQGDASLAGAQFTVRYYKGYYGEDELGSVKPARTWVIETDAKGRALMKDKYLVSGDKLYKNDDGDTVIPLGTVSVQETKAPDGYQVNDKLYVQQIKIDKSGNKADSFKISTVPQQIIRGGVQIQKWDNELGSSEALGGAEHGTASTGSSLAGIDFTVINRSENPVLVDGSTYAPGDEIVTLTTEWNEEKEAYTAETADDYLPYGTYEIREVKTNKSYLLTDGRPKTFEIRKDKGIVAADTDGEALVFRNNVKRGDISFTKVSDTTMERLAGVLFKLTNKTTGEAHILVTDDNGYVSTASDWNRHTQNTNANDHFMDGDVFDYTAGIWFGLGEFGSLAEADDDRGALPYGKYILDEIPSSANEGRKLLSNIEISVYKDSVTIDMGTLINEKIEQPEEEEPKDEPDEKQPDESEPLKPETPETPENTEESQSVKEPSVAEEKIITQPDDTEELDESAETGDNVPYYIIIAATVMMIMAAAIGLILTRKKRID